LAVLQGDFSAAANTMVVGFDQGTQRPFIVDMTGSRDVAVTFTRCAMHLDANAKPSPQPFVKDTPQPFGKQPTKTAPTQKKDYGSV